MRLDLGQAVLLPGTLGQYALDGEMEVLCLRWGRRPTRGHLDVVFWSVVVVKAGWNLEWMQPLESQNPCPGHRPGYSPDHRLETPRLAP